MVLNILFLSLSSKISVVYVICTCLTVIGCSVFFFFSVFFFLVFSVSHFYWVIFLLREYFLSHIQSVDKPIKDILHFCYGAFDPVRSFWPLENFQLCLHCPALLACSTLSFWALSFLMIILVLNSQAGNSIISAVSESLLTPDLSLQTYVFPFSVSCTFFC